MFRRRLIPLFAAACAVAAPAVASGAPFGPGTASPLASVRVLECRQGPGAEDRLALFRTSMRPVPGSERMWMRFSIQERVGGEPWRSVKTPGLGGWRRSRPGVQRFTVRQRVLELGEGASYRLVARLRWYDADGGILKRARRRSGACRQEGSLPNLRVVRALARPGATPGGLVRYGLDVANRGQAAAPSSALRLSVDGDAVDTIAVPALDPGQVARVWVSGPGCRSSLLARVDPLDAVRESREGDNTLATPCPPLR